MIQHAKHLEEKPRTVKLGTKEIDAEIALEFFSLGANYARLFKLDEGDEAVKLAFEKLVKINARRAD